MIFPSSWRIACANWPEPDLRALRDHRDILHAERRAVLGQ